MDECRDLAEYMAVPELDSANRGKVMTWNRLKDYLPDIGYKVEKKRKSINGKQQQCYFVSGEWHDVEIVDNDFLQLVDARSAAEQ